MMDANQDAIAKCEELLAILKGAKVEDDAVDRMTVPPKS
mgnify:CR=1 FL=1